MYKMEDITRTSLCCDGVKGTHFLNSQTLQNKENVRAMPRLERCH